MGWKDALASIPKILVQVYNLTHDLSKMQSNVEKQQEIIVSYGKSLASFEERIKTGEAAAKTVQVQQERIIKLENELHTMKALQEKQDKLHLKEIELSQRDLEKHITSQVKEQVDKFKHEFFTALQRYQQSPSSISPPVLSLPSHSSDIEDGKTS